MAQLFLDKTAAVLAKVLDGAVTRQSALADNIANVDTPGYTRKDVDFEGELRAVASSAALNPEQTIARINDVMPVMQDDLFSPRRGDGNNVEIEREMSQMAKNSLQYEVSAQLLTMNLTAVKKAIREGK
ncbi:MAG: flagellar basal body rod protein FlgB [Armatimonadota bacterium]